MADKKQLKLIEIGDFPKTTTVTGAGQEYIVVRKADGKTYGILTDNFKAFLGTVTSIAPRPLSPTDPTPTLDGVHIPTVTQNESGTPIVYSNAGGLTVNTAEGGEDYGNKVEFIKNGAVWVKSSYPLPMQDVSGLATKKEVEPIKEIISTSNNLVDNSTVTKGYYRYPEASYSDSINWISVVIDIESEWIGSTFTLSGAGRAPTSSARIVIRDLGDSVVEMIQGDNTDNPVSFTVSTLGKIYISIANDASDGGIGSRPEDNIYTHTMMLNEGAVPLPYDAYGALVRPDKINSPNSIVFTNIIEKDGKGAVPSSEIFKIKEKVDEVTVASKNLINTSSDVVRGFWDSSGIHNNSVNWIKTVMKVLPDDIIKKLKNLENVYIAISGGGSVPSSGSYLTFFDSDGAVLEVNSGDGSGTYPKTNLIPLSARGYGITIANDPSDGGIGSRPEINAFTHTFMVNEGDSVIPYEPYGVFVNPSKLPFDTSEIILKKINDNLFHIYYHIGGANDLWFRINLIHQTLPSKFVDVWRLNEGWIVQRVNDDFIDATQVVSTGVYENAIYTTDPGYTDALGSAHGWEMLNEFNLFMDGKQVNIQTVDIIKGNYLTFTTNTNFKTPDGLGNIGTSLKKWDFKDGVFKIANMVKWLGSLSIHSNSYFSMCSVYRENPNGIQITHSALSNDEMINYDVSGPGFTTPINTNDADPNRTLLMVWGDSFKAEMEILSRKIKLANGDVLPFGLPNAGMRVQNVSSPNYNKLYGRMGSTTVESGDVWEVETVYRLSNT